MILSKYFRTLTKYSKLLEFTIASSLARLTRHPFIKSVKLPTGASIVIDLREPLYRELFLGIPYEPEVTAFQKKILSPGDTFFDVGAHLGIHTLAARSIVGARGLIIAFEPTQKSFRLLEQNCLQFKNVTCEPIAVSDTNSQAVFNDYGDQYSYYNSISLSPRSEHLPKPHSYTVLTISLDSYLKNHSTLHPSLIKLDVENSEMPALLGAKKILENIGPPLIIETGDHGRTAENSTAACLKLISSFGYRFFEFNPNSGRLLKHTASKVYRSHTNILCLKDQ